MMNFNALDDANDWLPTQVTDCDKWAAWENAQGF
jgi:hypothetical protein